MDDLISRQAAIDGLYEMASDIDHLCTVKDYVDFLESLSTEPRWIPVKTRPMDEEEKRYWEEHYAYTFGEDYDGIMFDCPMPEDGQEVWVCSKSGYVWEDTCEVDIGFGLEGNGDWDDIVAWMPFERPEPWKGEADESVN